MIELSRTISHCPLELAYVERQEHISAAHPRGTDAHDQDERAARIARYAAQIARVEKLAGVRFMAGKRPGSKSPAPKPVIAALEDGRELARFPTVRHAALYLRETGRTRSPIYSIASTLRKALRRGYVSYGLRFATLAA